MPPPPKAIFLSYARDDAAAARRIAEALRSSGIEVWFDENELRGGDAWDAKIKKQIRDCALFMPIISRNTQERREGYFRLEWHLAEDRSRLIAKGTPFLVPVAIDDTGERDALVPEVFLAVQWTRLPGGEATDEFCARVRSLLEAGRPRPAQRDETPEAGGQMPEDGSRMSEDGRQRSEDRGLRSAEVRTGDRRSGMPWVVAAVAMVAVGLGAYFALRPSARDSAAATLNKPRAAAAQPPLDFVSAKSIAVLSFENLSPDKENAFFCDGMHEDVLAALQLVAELKVVGGRSVAPYRDNKTKSYQQIGAELGVAYVLEGSVRRVDDTVKIVGKLIDARTGQTVWIKPYERGLANVFAIQSELAQAIASELQAKLTPQAQSLLARRPTENAGAYDLYIKARTVFLEGNDEESEVPLQQMEAFLQSAVLLDPNFADAWAQLSFVHGLIHGHCYDHTDARLAKAKVAIDNAVRLASDSPVVVGRLGLYHLFAFNNSAKMVEQLGKWARLQPGNPDPYASMGYGLRRLKKYPETLVAWRKAAELDPASVEFAKGPVSMLADGRRYAEAMIEQRKLSRLQPNDPSRSYYVAYLSFLASGSTSDVEGWLAGVPPAQEGKPLAIAQRKEWARVHGDYAEAVRLDRLQPYSGSENNRLRWTEAIDAAFTLAALGDVSGARARLENFPATFRARLELDPTNYDVWTLLGLMEALLGNPAEALRCARRACELLPESVDSWIGAYPSLNLAMVQAWTGDKGGAIAALTRLLQVPLSLHVHALRHDPKWAPLQGDPRFEALLNDPKYNAPLF